MAVLKYKDENGNFVPLEYIAPSSVINNLVSDSEIDALAANQGKVLNEGINNLSNVIKGKYITSENVGELSTVRGILPFSIGEDVVVGNLTLPQWTKGMVFDAQNGSDASLFAVDMHGHVYTAFRNNANWTCGRRADSNLVAEAILASDSDYLEVSGLNIIQDGGIYDIVVAEYSTSSSGSGHVIRINGANYSCTFNHIVGDWGNPLITSSGETSGIGYTNGWSMERRMFYTTATLIYFNENWIALNGQSSCAPSANDKMLNVIQTGAVNNQGIANINSLKIVPLDGGKIGADSYIKIYRR